jgi:phospholipase/carboxylesterase
MLVPPTTTEVPVVDGRWTGDGDAPMVARWGSEHPAAPLVVALHGNGTSEHSLIEISPWLPHGPVTYIAVRAPIEHGRGFSWYLDERDLPRTAQWLLDWLDTEGDPDRAVLLLGFREGVALAGTLMLTAPDRFAGAMLIYGALPFDAGLPMPPAALAGMPVFLAHGTEDTRTPNELLDRTRDWLATRSGAPLWAEREPGGEQLAGGVVAGLATWLGDRLDHLRAHGENPLPDSEQPTWPALGGRLPERAGDPPRVSAKIPQHQSTQNAPPQLQAALWQRLTSLDGVRAAPTKIGIEGTRALLLDRATTTGPDTAFLLPGDGEFAHQHPDPDGSLHLCLPYPLGYDALAKGWAIPHPLAGLRVSAGMVLVPGPRNAEEVDIVAGIATGAHHYATAGDS